MGEPKVKPSPEIEESKIGVYSKQEAAAFIASGCAHVHSAKEVVVAPEFQVTKDNLKSSMFNPYLWQKPRASVKFHIDSSGARKDVINDAAFVLKVDERQNFRGKLDMVLEELLTNAIYHSYVRDGKQKYDRKKSVSLEEGEDVTLEVGNLPNGVFVSVADTGGMLTFPRVQSCFERCYKKDAVSQIEIKDSGAGLGIYMVFETVTHLRIDVAPGEYTRVDCWIADRKTFDREHFSFNFFEVKKS